MKITAIETYPLVWEKLKQIVWSRGAVHSEHGLLLVRVHTDTGLVGQGEAHGGKLFGVTGDFTHRMTKTAAIINEGLKEQVIGEDPLNNERIWHKMFSIINKPGWNIPGWSQSEIMTAIGAVDVAMWDIKGKAAGMPIWKLLGGYDNRVTCYVTGGYYAKGKTNVDLVKECEGYLALGYRAIKLKIGGLELKDDLERIRVVRNAVGPDVKLMVDVNEGWDVETAIRGAKALEEFDIFWLEEPVVWYDNIEGLRKVADATSVPIAAGEKVTTRWAGRDLIERGGVRVMQFDCTKAAGPTEWLKVAGLAACHHVRMAPHHEPQIHGHLLAAIPNGLLQESFPDPARDPVWPELYSVKPEIKNGEIVFSDDLPGWGVEYDEKVIEKRLLKA